jgi:hypothetical protein
MLVTDPKKVISLKHLIECAKLCEAAYWDDEKIAMTYVGSQVFHCDETDLFIWPFEGITKVVFRGTSSKADILHDLDVRKVDWMGGKVHRGFFEAAMKATEAVKKALSFGNKIGIYSHSLGSAVGTIFGLMYPASIFEIVSFGSPRCLDKTLADKYKPLLHDKTFRILSSVDPVPRVPSRVRFQHVGQSWYIPNNVWQETQLVPSLTVGEQIGAYISEIAGSWGHKGGTVSSIMANHYIHTYVERLTLLERIAGGDGKVQ